MKLPITGEWISEKAAMEGDADPTTGKPIYIPGFVPSAADRHYDEIIAQYAAALAAKDAEIENLKAELAATYEELIDHTGDDLNDTRARRVAALKGDAA